MRYAGIDIGAEKHWAAVVEAEGNVVAKSAAFHEDMEGYAKLFEHLGEPKDLLVVMEATGHYWQNLYFALLDRQYAVAVVNPLRTSRFAEEDIARAKTDKVDALQIANFAAQKRPSITHLPDELTLELRELVRMRDRVVQELGDRTRQMHRLVDLVFPELTRHISDLSSHLATTVIKRWPTPEQLAKQSVSRVAKTVYDGRHAIGEALAEALIGDAKRSVGRHKGGTYVMQAEYLCEDIAALRSRLKRIDKDSAGMLEKHDLGQLLTTIDGIGDTTAARLLAELGDPAAFESPGALAAYVGLAPRVNHSGKRTPTRGPLHSMGKADLRAKLWMPVLTAVKKNPWLRAFYERLIARGKLPKVALIAAMRKLLSAVYSVAKNRKPFVPTLTAEPVSTGTK